jgi:UDP-sugar transporter A1/2/3
LAAGVGVVQLSSLSSKTGVGEGDAAAVERNQMIGLVAVISSCFTSGFAGVYFEKVLKGSSGGQEKTSVYMRNCQLAVFSIVFALVPVLTKDYAINAEKGFFAGYDATVWLVIFCQMMTGLIVALVMKYANAILKGFCTSVAVVVATVLSIWLFGTRVDAWFALGAIMVVGAVQLYSKYPPNAK